MIDQEGRPEEKSYSVDEILAEFGSGGEKRPKVVEFPEPEPELPQWRPKDTPRPAPEPEPEEERPAPRQCRDGRGQGKKKRGAPVEPMAEIAPVSPLHGAAARLHTLLRRADHYADHMYDQAEPDEATRKAEQYLPGVDQELPPDEDAPAREKRREKAGRSRPAPADVPPDVLARRYAQGLRGMRVRTALAVVFALLCAGVSVDIPQVFDWSGAAGAVELPFLRQTLVLGLLVVVGALCCDVIVGGLAGFFTARPRAQALPALAFLFTAADSAALLASPWRQGVSCGAVTALSLALTLWGSYARQGADRLSARSAAQSKEPYAVTLDDAKWSGRPAYAKWSGTGAGFGSQLQEADGVSRAYAVAAPVLIVCCLVCAGLSAAHGGSWRQFLWTASAMFTACSAWPALLVYSIPYRHLARRLFDVGAALAGWPGVRRCREAGILMTDQDLFPPGTVRVSGVRVFGDFANEKVVAYTATLLRLLGCGLTRPFHDLLRSQGAFYREASGVRFHEGGVTGIIRNQEVFVGTAGFMHLMDVELPQGMNVKHAVFCAIGGELAGIFALSYDMSPAVRPCLGALMRAGASPILATRDPNLIPDLLGQKFKLPVDKMEFPPVDRRLELSGTEQEHNGTLVALLSREGLTPYCDAVVGGMRLRSAVRRGMAFTLLGAALGAALTFYLTYVGAAASLTPGRFLAFMALWLVPAALLSNWVNQY